MSETVFYVDKYEVGGTVRASQRNTPKLEGGVVSYGPYLTCEEAEEELERLSLKERE
jgi:hypothetical protein